MSGLRIEKTHWNSTKGIVRHDWNPKPQLPKVITEISKFLTLFRNQNEVMVKSDPKPIGAFTNSMLNDRIELKDENCLRVSLGGK
jgi:hypothetical protein